MPRLLVPAVVFMFAFQLAAAETRPRIVNGSNVPETELPVGKLGRPADFAASGVLIAPKVVLTAAHCVTRSDGTQVGDDQIEFSFNGTTYTSERIYVHPSYHGFADIYEGQFDIALVFLTQAVAGVTPAPIFRQVPTVGATLQLAGFGAASYEDTTDPPLGTVNIGSTTLDKITPTFLYNLVATGEADTVPGDSGGPAFIDVGGVRHVAGIHSGGATSRNGKPVYSFDARVDRVADWIDGLVGTSQAPGTGALAFLRGPGATYFPAAAGEPIRFFCHASEFNLNWTWNFGDGTPDDRSGPFPLHSFSAAGEYTVTVTATRPSDGMTVSGTLPVTVLAATVSQAFPAKQSFSFTFSAPEKAKMQIPLLNFAFEDVSRLTGSMALYLNGRLFDTVAFNGKSGKGAASSVKASKLKLSCTLTGAKVAEALREAGNLESEPNLTVRFS